jgi:hypothetical protein
MGWHKLGLTHPPGIWSWSIGVAEYTELPCCNCSHLTLGLSQGPQLDLQFGPYSRTWDVIGRDTLCRRLTHEGPCHTLLVVQRCAHSLESRVDCSSVGVCDVTTRFSCN